jgi:hypothetical protein
MEAKRSEKIEAKRSEKIGPLFSLEHAKTKRNESRFASFRFEAKKYFMQNRRTLIALDPVKNDLSSKGHLTKKLFIAVFGTFT